MTRPTPIQPHGLDDARVSHIMLDTEWDPTVNSYVVVASDGRRGIPIFWVGGHAAEIIGDTDANDPDINDPWTWQSWDGLPSAPGIYVWEGYWVREFEYVGWEDDDADSDIVAVGRFRAPTPDEWRAIERGTCPWNTADWYLRAPSVSLCDTNITFYRTRDQGVNENPRGARVVHTPTGIDVRCDDYRTAGKNLQIARVRLARQLAETQAGEL